MTKNLYIVFSCILAIRLRHFVAELLQTSLLDTSELLIQIIYICKNDGKTSVKIVIDIRMMHFFFNEKMNLYLFCTYFSISGAQWTKS